MKGNLEKRKNIKKFTFKKSIKEGQYRSFQKDNTDIKLEKKVVGRIYENEQGTYFISFAVKKERTEQDPAPFRWIRLGKVSKTEDEARETVKLFYKEIQKKYDLFPFSDRE